MRLAFAALAATVMLAPAIVRDVGQWRGHVREWFRSLSQPDNTAISCCGEADAYWVDSFEVAGDQYVAIVTNEREDAPLHRPHRNAGERIVVPNHKIKWDAGNPTGHGVLFIIADDWQALPVLLQRARHRRAWCMGNGCLCMGSFVIFVPYPPPVEST